MKKAIYISLLISILVISYSSAGYCWGPMTHVAIGLDARDRGNCPVPDQYIGSYLAGCIEPDLVTAGYAVLHEDQKKEFIKAMRDTAVDLKSPDREKLLARALGMETHLASDAVVHVENGYVNVKEVYNESLVNEKKCGFGNHQAVEFFTDILSVKKQKTNIDKFPIEFVDADTFKKVSERYEKNTGTTLPQAMKDKGEIDKNILKLRTSVETEKNITEYLTKNKPSSIAEIDSMLSDRHNGLSGGNGGINQAVENTTALYKKSTKIEPGKENKLSLFDKILNFLGFSTKRAVAAGQSLAIKGMESVLIARVGLQPNSDNGVRLNPLVAEKLGSEYTMMVNTCLNLVRKDTTLAEDLYTAQNSSLGSGSQTGSKYEDAKMNIAALQGMIKRAQEKVNQNPGNAKYLNELNALKKQLDAKNAELDSLKSEYRKSILEQINSYKETLNKTQIDLASIEKQNNSTEKDLKIIELYKNSIIYQKSRIEKCQSKLKEIDSQNVIASSSSSPVETVKPVTTVQPGDAASINQKSEAAQNAYRQFIEAVNSGDQNMIEVARKNLVQAQKEYEAIKNGSK